MSLSGERLLALSFLSSSFLLVEGQYPFCTHSPPPNPLRDRQVRMPRIHGSLWEHRPLGSAQSQRSSARARPRGACPACGCPRSPPGARFPSARAQGLRSGHRAGAAHSEQCRRRRRRQRETRTVSQGAAREQAGTFARAQRRTARLGARSRPRAGGAQRGWVGTRLRPALGSGFRGRLEAPPEP